MSEATAHLAEASGGVPLVLAVGADAVPLSVSRALRVIRLPVSPRGKTEPPEASADALYPPDAIAVIGMSCKLPGADSMGEFWQLLTEGKSMVERVPANRWPESSRPGSNNSNNNNNSRSSSGGAVKTYWGNFVRGYDEFDHRFFKKSSREAASMDPQQRLLLQAAYEAMASSGYFTPRPVARPADVGCYLGLCAVDYDSNVGSHAPNAFSTLGTLRAFLSGKISHFFGWQGPSLTFDTACSSSAVAIHTACRAIQAGECSQALAGGVALFTSPYLFENLSAAHFLSPTGATKPFDARADGYCRGEGLGLVVLKRLSAAVADGDEILAVLGGSAINQNANCVPITVPNAPSQGALYLQVAKLARVQPQDVSLVESHGTGTPVGDPIEMDSIRAVFGGAHRRHPLLVSSVKGNIGHLEGASGVAGLIKAILQIQHRTAVPQASFQSLNPKIPPLGPDRVEIPRRNVPLPHGFLTVCVNNYGAAGSNAAMMVMEPPPPPVPPQARSADTSSTAAEHILPPDSKKPVLITANSAASLLQYCEALRSYCRQLQQQQQRGERANDAQGPQQLFDNIVCHLARRQNHELPFAFTAVAADLPELEAQLSRELSASPQPRPSPRPPLVLAFGGQTRDYAGLSKRLWEQSWPLRRHLDRCHDEVRALGHEAGLYPAVFQSQPITDLVTLHVCLFSIQYATAQAWIDAGLAVSAVIGHSLGQLAALAVSGVLSLSDGLRFVAGRAELMQRHWGPEPGAMIAVEAESHVIAGLLAEHPLEIACHNGPSSYVLVGDRQCVDNVGRTLGEQGRRYKRLDVTNGFHSKFTEPVIGPLQELASTLHFRKAHIPIETCSDGATWSLPTAHLLARHTREPVFFSQAVQRLAAARGASTWLEAGFDSGVTSMVRRALENPKGHSFQALSLGRADALESVVDATLQLWRQGHGVQLNVPSPVRGGTPLHLPPYQFEKNQHWLELAPPATLAGKTSPAPAPEQTERVPQLVRLIQHDQSRGIARFEIDPHCEEYQSLVAGHVVAGSPLCPATVYMEIAARACQLLLISSSNATAPLPSRPQFLPLLGFSDVRINAPLGLAVDRRLELTLHQKDRHSAHTWDFTVTGSGTSSQVPTAAAVTHVEGNVFVRNDEAAVETEFARYERLTGLAAVEGLLGDQESELIRGESLYKLFARVVEYGGPYRGLRSAAAKDGRIAGTAVLAAGFESLVESTLTQPPTVDSFMQIAGLHANCIHPCAASDVCVFTQMDHLQFGPGYADSLKTAQPWAVFSNMTRIGSKEIANDIFVFDQSSGRLVVLILGARFHNVRLSSLSKVLSRVNDGDAAGGRNTEVTFSDSLSSRAATAAPSRQPQHEPTTIAAPVIRGRSIVFEEVCNVYEKVAEVPRAKITGTMTADDLGVDSLMMMEVISELSAHFDTHLPIDDLEKLTDVDSLVDYLRSRGCGPRDSDTTASQSPSSSSSSLSSPSDTEASDASNADSSGGIPLQQQKQVDKLASLLQDHLELAAPPKLDANLANLGLDSLLAIELASDIEKFLGVTIDLYQLDETSSFGQLVHTTVVSAASHPISDPQNGLQYTSDEGQYSDKNNDLNPTVAEVVELPEPSAVFQELRWGFDTFADQEGFTRFWRSVYPEQARLVLAYAADAFRKLGVDLTKLRAGQPVPELQGVLPKHRHLVARLHHILASGGYVHGQPGARYTRSSMPLRLGDPQELLSTIVARFPRHAAEHRLLDLTGSRLAECLTGQTDPLSLLFASRSNRQLVADVYDLSPMCRAATRLLANYITHAFPPNRLGRVFHFLEVGGGTG
ncbi:ketoacyl-synt-domain-containing protein, partial [Thozetella sp. PMI_491]